MISILVPTLNEEEGITACLERARTSIPGAQIIVSDGGSSDRTLEKAAPYAELLAGPRGRGRQLNSAATHARGDILLFLHADTLLPDESIEQEIETRMSDPAVIGGSFQVHFAPQDTGVWLLECAYSLVRSQGMFFGDSAIFVRRDPFLARGGFHQEELMEDVELVRWMRKTGSIILLSKTVITSSRRFRGKVAFHLLIWTLLHGMFYCGLPDSFLARLYPSHSGSKPG